MAERPDPDTDRRNILPGEHAKPDGTWCPYLAPSNEAGVWVCMKCGNSGGVSTPDTDPNTLADRLDNGWMLTNSEMRAAADGLRQYAAITAAIGDPDDASVMCPPEIRPDSWLHDDRHDGVAEFRSALDYARTQTRFIQAAAGVKPEALFYIWSLLNRGARNAAASLSPTPTPDHCPTCRGTWKIVRGQHPHYACSNVAWHDSQS